MDHMLSSRHKNKTKQSKCQYNRIQLHFVTLLTDKEFSDANKQTNNQTNKPSLVIKVNPHCWRKKKSH